MREFTCEVEVSKQMVSDYSGQVGVFEFIKRQLARKIVSELPISDLEKLIQFVRVSGADPSTLDFVSPERADILMFRGTELHIAKIKIPD